jgi:hypothetical protein
LFTLSGDVQAESPDVEWARIQQQELPRYTGRLAGADARIIAARAYFSGSLTLGAAFPAVAAGRLGSESWLRGRLAQLDDAGVLRAAERVAPPPALGNTARQTQWRLAQEQALDAEETADVLERRVLLGLLQLLDDHPAVSDAALAPERARLAYLTQRAEIAWASAQSPELARQVALLQEDEFLFNDAVARLQLSATSPRAAPPDPTRDLALLQQPGRALAAMARLTLLEPFLGPEALAQVRAGEKSVLDGPATDAARAELDQAQRAVIRIRTLDPVESIEVLEERLARADATLTDAVQRLAPLSRGEPNSLERSRRDLAELQREAAQTWRDAAVMAVEVRQAGSRAVLDAKYRAEKAAAAREKAARAEERAETPEEWAAAHLRATEAKAAEETAHMAQSREFVRGRFQTLRNGLAKRLQPLPKQDLVVGDYASARQLVADIRGHLRTAEHERTRLVRDAEGRRQQVSDARQGLAKSRKGVSELSDELMQSLFNLVLSDWEEALDGQLALVDAGIQDQVVHAEELQILLQRARRDQVAALPVATGADRAFDRDNLARDLSAEWSLLGATLGEILQERWLTMASVGRSLDAGDGQRETVLRTASGILVLVIAWVWLRRRAGWIVGLTERWVQRSQRSGINQDLSEIALPLESAVRSTIDLAACWAILVPAGLLLQELGLTVLIVLGLTTWRLVNALFELLVSEYPDARPAAFTLMPKGRALARMLVRGLALWFIFRALAQALVLAVLGSVPMALATATLADLALAALLLVVFHRWEPLIRAGLAHWESGGPLTRWLASEPRVPLLTGWFRGALGFCLAMTQRLTSRVRGPGTNGPLRRLMAVIRPETMDATETHTPLPRDLAQSLLAPADPERLLPRPRLDAELKQAIGTWRETGNRGAVLVHGDRGHGKHTWLDQVVRSDVVIGLRVRRARLQGRLTTTQGACEWLAVSLGLASTCERSLHGLREALADLPPSLIVLEDTHRAFLRTVHGFDGLRALLQVVGQAGNRHFWILSMHGPAWHYLSRLGGLLNLQMFGKVLRLEPWSLTELRTLLEGPRTT